MSNKEDVIFTFGTKMFENGVKQAGHMMAGFGDMTKNISKGMGQAINGLIGKIAIMGIAWKGIKAVLEAMPEVGQAFDIAKDIFMQNLVWPLRNAVMPLLQKMLNWVRDNRAMFVKWGQTLVTIFKTAANIAGRFFEIILDFGKKIGASLARIFGVFGKNIDDTINILLFKISTLMMFVSDLISPIVKIVGDVLSKIIEFVGEVGKGFLSGIFKDFDKVGKNLEDIWKSISDILDKLFFSDAAKKRWSDIFKFIGETITETFRIVTDILNVLLKLIDNVITFAQNPTLENFQKIFEKDIDRDDKERLKNYKPREEIKVEPLSADKVLQIYNGKSNTQNVNPQVQQNNTFYLQVTEGDAKKAGKNFADGMNESTTNKIKNQQLRIGD